MERKIIDYLPQYVRDFAEISAIMEAEQPEIEKAWESAENVMSDQFIVDATENGVKRMESILNLKPKGTFTLDERKFNILAKLNEQLPYTIESLDTTLKSLCGEGGYTLKLDYDHYTLFVKLALSNEHNFEAVESLLGNIAPANLVKIVATFNSHSMLSGHTHEQLARFTHKELKEAIL